MREASVCFAQAATRGIGGNMFTAKESALLFEMSHRLRELHEQRAAAQGSRDHERAEALQSEIDVLTGNCDRLVDADGAI